MKYQSINSLFKAISKLKVLVIGDIMVDSYVWGKVDRISPEAPVPVVHVLHRESRLGGAGNVGYNCLALGATPLIVSFTGKDISGSSLTRLMNVLHLDSSGILQSKNRKTTIKERIIAGTQQLLRVDDESHEALNNKENSLLLDKISRVLPSCQLVIFEDYDKGILGRNNIGEIILMAKKKGIPTIVDPKKINFSSYQGADLFKPNFKEIREGFDTHLESGNITKLKDVTGRMIKQLSLSSVMVTLSENGIFYRNAHQTTHVKAHKREISDVSGAGDTVVSIAGICYALGLPPRFIAELSNLGGGIVCETPGVVPVSREKLIKEAGLYKLASYLKSR